MSQFDYPRLNFFGKATASPATGNNDDKAPLALYDSNHATALIPPRIYISKDYLKEGYTIQDVADRLPKGSPLKGTDPQNTFFTIDSVSDMEAFKEWVVTPLGESPLDAAYHDLYEIVLAVRVGDNVPLKGNIPGYWNYYGDYSFSFSSTQVRSIVLKGKNKELIYDENSTDLPSEFQEVLGADLNMGRASIVDPTPTIATFSQVFCDYMSLVGEKVLFKGKPHMAGLRHLNLFRVVNLEMPYAGSGDFSTVIPIEELEEGEKAPIIRLFRKHGRNRRKIRGVFIKYNLFEVYEKRPFKYLEEGRIQSPARFSVCGSISPWYEGEMTSITIGRQLMRDENFYKDDFMVPVMCRVDYRRNSVWLDLFNNIPMEQHKDGTYEVLDFGKLSLKVKDKKGKFHTLGEVTISPQAYNRAESIRRNGIFHFPLQVAKRILREGSLALHLIGKDGKETSIMKESEYAIYSDQAGLYANQGDDPSKGYMHSQGVKSPCILRIWRKGVPVKKPTLFTVIAFEGKQAGVAAVGSIRRYERYQDGDVIAFSTLEPSSTVFTFLPGRVDKVPDMGFLTVFVNGKIVVLRVLPQKDYSAYLDPKNPAYKKVTFQVLKEEIFDTYDYIYPAMGHIIPFDEKVYKSPYVLKELKKRIAVDNWSYASYMPPTRELSDSQRDLINRWIELIEEKEEAAGERKTPEITDMEVKIKKWTY